MRFLTKLQALIPGLLLMWACAAWPQASEPTTPPDKQITNSAQSGNEPRNQNSGDAKAPDQPQTPSTSGPEKVISPQQAKELFHSVDELMKFASDDTGLPIKHE